jgi:hypothetical protein
MGSASIIIGEVVALTPPAEVPTTSATRGGVPTLASATGGEVTTFSTAPHGGVAVCASSASASPTTCGSGDLVWEGDDWATGTPCGLATGLHCKTPHKENNLQEITYKMKLAKTLPRHCWKLSLRPKHSRLNSCRHPHLRRCNTTLRLQSTSKSILRRLLHKLPLPLGSRTLRPSRCLILRERQLLDRLIFFLLRLLLLFRFDLPRARCWNRRSDNRRR